MKLAIVGSRGFCDYALMKAELSQISDIRMIISGGAIGADTLAARYAKENEIDMTVIKPAWELFGRSAGILRNREIVDQSNWVIAFWDGKSKGTEFTITYAKGLNKLLKVVL